MSYDVYCKGENVWQPARRVGDYFLANIKILEKLIESSSGIESHIADDIQIDAEMLSNFVEKTLNFIEKTNNTRLVAMMSGIVEVIVALNAEINNIHPEVTPKNRSLIERSKKVFYPIEDYMS
jgi:hypothetical protein